MVANNLGLNPTIPCSVKFRKPQIWPFGAYTTCARLKNLLFLCYELQASNTMFHALNALQGWQKEFGVNDEHQRAISIVGSMCL